VSTTSRAPQKQNSAEPAADEFSFDSVGSPFADKSEYIEKKLTFRILAIEREEGRGFDDGDRWAVTVEPNDGRGAEIITLGCNEQRDAKMIAAQQNLAARGPIPNVRLKKSGKAYYFDNSGAGRAK
jgi:hypothetical protein